MKFGLFGGGRVGKLDPLGDSYGYRDFIRYIEDADQMGFENAFVVEHHFTGQGQLSASLNLLSFLAARTSRIRLGTAVVVLPWHNPVLLAEQVTTLDVLSEGRVNLGVGRGYRKAEFDQFCIPMAEEAQERYAECLALMLKAFTSRERFSWHSKYWNFEDIVVEPAPVQLPHPPIWMAAGRAEGIAFVGQSNYNLLLDHIANIEETSERVKIYKDAQAASGIAPDASRVGVARQLNFVYTPEERRAAYRKRRESLVNIRELAKKPEGYDPTKFDDDDIAADNAALIGTPEEIVERLQCLAEGGVEHVLLTPANVSRKTLDTFANKVLPHIKQPSTQRAASLSAAA